MGMWVRKPERCSLDGIHSSVVEGCVTVVSRFVRDKREGM